MCVYVCVCLCSDAYVQNSFSVCSLVCQVISVVSILNTCVKTRLHMWMVCMCLCGCVCVCGHDSFFFIAYIHWSKLKPLFFQTLHAACISNLQVGQTYAQCQHVCLWRMAVCIIVKFAASFHHIPLRNPFKIVIGLPLFGLMPIHN